MKRKLFAITLGLALLISAYTVYACLSTRGLRVYLMGTRMGTVLSASWQFTLLAAVALWIPGVVALVRRVPGPRICGVAARHGVEATEILDPRAGTAVLVDIVSPADAGGATEWIEEPAPAGSMPTETAPMDPPRSLSETSVSPVPTQRVKLRFCTNCGYSVKGNFCPRCGTKVNK